MSSTSIVGSISRAFRSHSQSEWEVGAERLCEFVQQGDLSIDEISELTRAIADSGEVVRLSAGNYCDIPSTGGPGSLTTLLAPILLASSGARVPKISATGSVAGGIDVLAMIPGFRSSLSVERFRSLTNGVGIAHIKQTDRFCPADAVLIDVRRNRGLMRHVSLAAISLLAKKLAVQGSRALFDFRMGITGNIGDTPSAAVDAAELFFAVAEQLGLEVGVAITDNLSFPSSALGRLESLDLLVQCLRGDAALRLLDTSHRDVCVLLAEAGLELVGGEAKPDAYGTVGLSLRSGAAYELFVEHLSAQGSSEDALLRTLGERLLQQELPICIRSSGYWKPPDLSRARDWIKAAQRPLGSAAADQVGYRLSVSPGEWVDSGSQVATVRLPRGASVDMPTWLEGRVDDAPCRPNAGVIAMRLGHGRWRDRQAPPLP